MYTALVLDELHQNALLQLVNVPEGWEGKCHHMTLHMGPHAPEVDPPLGSRHEILLVAAAFNAQVAAFEAKTDLPVASGLPHVTAAVNTNGGGKPVMSKDLTDWKQLDQAIMATGVIRECE